MVNTYSGALTQVKDQAVVVKPLRATPDQTELVVRSEVRGKGDPIQLDYRLEKAGDGWKIYDVNVGGFWLVDAYKGQFAKDLSNGGIDALITRLAEKNKSLASAKN
jgi:phospholipid transport system substrate-binding protein